MDHHPTASRRWPAPRADHERPATTLQWAGWLLGLLALAALAGIVLRRGEVERFLGLLGSLAPAWLGLAVVLQLATYACVATAWWLGLDRAGAHRPWNALIGLAVAKLFVDQSVPTGGIAGTAFLVNVLARQGVPRSACMATLVTNFVGFHGAYLLSALAGMGLLWLRHDARPWMHTITIVFVIVAAAVPLGLFALHHYGRRAPAWVERLPGVAALLEAAAEAPVAQLLRRGRLLAATAALNLAVIAADAATLWTMLHALGLHASYAVAYPSFLLAMMVATVSPIPMGLGTFEAASVAALSTQGVPLEGALAGTLLLRGCTTWVPMAPGLWLARRALREARDRA
ncbi:lysylphosphatidylglycerol synthase transmembrane domain-containing protein [Frateuria soli]|uniref:lysylphosphatidylglycerol synthase transmembrane domain-containing protein n=1 Tax=Frateuria soli TaxID=1542730 RepID=UPI001E2F7DAA|nr:lysylphosphatidylglycerol synthase transmembrane domain-containing protein [Frateuria soli]UGB39581.1 flippase-like domain-containing protein [Frateuria soli]